MGPAYGGRSGSPGSKLEGLAVHAQPDQARSPVFRAIGLVMTSAVLRLVLIKISPLRDLLADDLLDSEGINWSAWP